ncbi:MAG: ankrd52 [Rickettsiaceae bacterium]|jgi:ankyrin repeat protein|nr:ankrd52 [Rickettsiaceae bacterium]
MFTKKDLKKAIKANNYTEVEKIVSENPNLINDPNEHGFTLLHNLNHIKNDIAVLLIERAADVNHASELGITPLHLAVRNGNNKIVKLLIKKGAEINSQDHQGVTPLGYAVKAKENASYLESIKLLIEAKAAINIQDFVGETPLFLAAENDNGLAMELLLKNGADVNIVDNNGRNALFCAAKHKLFFPILMLVQYGIKLDVTDKYGLDFLGYIEHNQYMKLVQSFINTIKLEAKNHNKFDNDTDLVVPNEEVAVLGGEALSEDAEI